MATSVISGPRRKLALVIGISDYDNGKNLPNAINDAKAMSSALKSIGFILHEGGPKLNPTYKEMYVTLAAFECSIKTGDMVLFYYAGHGTQWEDQNYLIPSDNFKEEIKGNIIEKVKLSGSDLKKCAINAQYLLNDINDRDPFVTIFFLDCCRTYHLRNQQLQKNSRGEQIHHPQGLKPMPAKVGSLIAFACAPGTVADDGEQGQTNGLFTKHLLKHLKTPNDDIRMILADVTHGVIQESKLQQIPHVTSILAHRNICLYNHISVSSTTTTTDVTKPEEKNNSKNSETGTAPTANSDFLSTIYNWFYSKPKQNKTKFNKFKQQGIICAGGNGDGDQLNQLSLPQGIFIDQHNNIFIADLDNRRIVEWKCHSNNGQIVAGGNGEGNRNDQLSYPADVLVDKQNNSLIISDRGNRRVIRCFRQNSTKQQILISDIACFGPAMDKYGFIYVSNVKNNEVRRWKEGDERGRIVAGGNGKGNDLNQLNSPTFIFVDEDDSLYVSDCGNHRVMKWRKNAKEGIVVAGGNGKGNSLKQLSNPQGVIVDHLGQIYVADFGNHRVMRWCEGNAEGSIVVGGNGQGKEVNQLNVPLVFHLIRKKIFMLLIVGIIEY